MMDRSVSSDETPDENADIDLTGLPDIVDRIVDTMRRGKVDRLILSKGDFHLELRTSGRQAAGTGLPQYMSFAGDEPSSDDSPSADVHTVTSPMIGTFYAAPAPGEQPFVRTGDTVAQGDTIGIVEAMKIMNEIAADRSGTVIEVAAADGETVEYGSPLVRLQIQT
ncbi:MAG: biotin/lipoyl-containing protein [Thermomicrobiales bacterium]